MHVTMMKSKIHRATVTGADLAYEGSISLDPALIAAAGLLRNEQVDVLNCNNGARFTTYVIEGGPGEVTLNGAAARMVQRVDVVIVVAYGMMDAAEAATFEPKVVFVDGNNAVRELRQDAAGRVAA